MAATRKYEGLPDLDAAPDVYETPELVDDVSTLQETSARSPSEHSEDDGTFQDMQSGIDRRRWQSDEARSRFRPARVKADNVDFSDRLNTTRRSYKTYTSRRRAGTYDDDPEEIRNFSDEDDEDLDAKLARLRREVEQVKAQLEERTPTEADLTQDPLTSISKISDVLDAVYNERHGASAIGDAGLAQTVKKYQKAAKTANGSRAAAEQHAMPQTTSQAASQPDAQMVQALETAASFDSRLSYLENALGLTGSNLPDTGIDAPKIILPTLANLERLVDLATASPSAIDAAQSKTRQLVKDAERLQRLRAEETEANGVKDQAIAGPASQAIETSEQTAKINALYGLLPTIDTLSPTLPLVLERLRTLQLLHTSAAGSSETLDDIERRQAEQAEELKQWREALEKVERNLEEGQTALAENVDKVGEWVKGLEVKVEKLS